ncbi:MAG: formylglycine-generating enzyme family protein [Planctomycetota bacterium]
MPYLHRTALAASLALTCSAGLHAEETSPQKSDGSCCGTPPGRTAQLNAWLAAAAAQATAEQQITGANAVVADAPEGMAWVPGGEFIMGTDAPNTWNNEHPAHRVQVDGFWMDQTEVTNAQFAQFVEATGYVTVAERPIDWNEMKKQLPPGTPKPPAAMLEPGSLVFTPPNHRVDLRNVGAWWSWTPGANWKHPKGPNSSIEGRENYPVVQVAWEDAMAFAKWAGKQLPTEAQWEYAARGGGDNTRFAWGETFKPGGKSMANTWDGEFPHKNTQEDKYRLAAPVKSFPANGFGLYETAGNVWEWTADYYRDDRHVALAKQDLAINPKGPDVPADAANPGAKSRVIKGGSFLCHVDYCESYRPPARRGTPEDTGLQHTGFRCIIVPEQN